MKLSSSLITGVINTSDDVCLDKKYVLAHRMLDNKSKVSTVRCKGGPS